MNYQRMATAINPNTTNPSNMKTTKTPTKEMQRKYMEALRTMSSKKGFFSAKDVLTSHGLSVAATTHLVKQGWLKPLKRKGCQWIGPKPRTEEELFRMATIVRQAYKGYQREYYRKVKGVVEKVVEQPAAVVNSSASTLGTVNPAFVSVKVPRKQAARKAREVSVLWGLFKVKY